MHPNIGRQTWPFGTVERSAVGACQIGEDGSWGVASAFVGCELRGPALSELLLGRWPLEFTEGLPCE